MIDLHISTINKMRGVIDLRLVTILLLSLYLSFWRGGLG